MQEKGLFCLFFVAKPAFFCHELSTRKIRIYYPFDIEFYRFDNKTRKIMFGLKEVEFRWRSKDFFTVIHGQR